ncbi:hypothetical protein P5G50_18550 [Leifsonia sp. F6_8S_P_1B]|uniref:Uncharacterized protein n=1 Tax=Leifsonia williamsii TaxID=3035919 RepID=A0ABT8KHI5_9MICO|nr:hypothetical protein [Leifsonia williamsii]MDN4616453.1 hypothetical protein [Leifsonia williamsii]
MDALVVVDHPFRGGSVGHDLVLGSVVPMAEVSVREFMGERRPVVDGPHAGSDDNEVVVG